MWMLWLLGLFLFAVPALAEPGFSEKYERDYNIFTPLNQYRADNPLNPLNELNPTMPFVPLNQPYRSDH